MDEFGSLNDNIVGSLITFVFEGKGSLGHHVCLLLFGEAIGIESIQHKGIVDHSSIDELGYSMKLNQI